ncbi:MAG: Fur family transcriptional regulator [Nitrospinaceae bacterium]
MFQEIEILKDYIRQNNLRWTPQRKTVLEVFLDMEGHVEIEEVFEEVRKNDPTIGIATVYRTMNLLAECGLARDNTSPTGKKNFEKLYRQSHHDHLICIGCGKIVEFEHPLIERYQLEICQRYGFTLNHHRMEILGICPECKDEPESP